MVNARSNTSINGRRVQSTFNMSIGLPTCCAPMFCTTAVVPTEASNFAAKAMPIIEAAQRLEPNEADIEKAKAMAMALMGQKDEALVSSTRVRELYPRSLDDWGGSELSVWRHGSTGDCRAR